MPETVSIGTGKASATVRIGTKPVYDATSAVIYLSTGRSEAKAQLTINPPSVARVTVSPSTVIGGSSATGTVVLSGKAPGDGVTVATSVDGDVAGVEGKVFVPGGKTSATFSIETAQVKEAVKVSIVAAYGKKSSTTLNVAPLSLKAISAAPSSVASGKTGRLTIQLNGKTTEPVTLYLKTGDADLVPVKETVTIKAGASSATVSFKAGAVKELVKVEVVAVYGDSAVSAGVVITPPTK